MGGTPGALGVGMTPGAPMTGMAIVSTLIGGGGLILLIVMYEMN